MANICRSALCLLLCTILLWVCNKMGVKNVNFFLNSHSFIFQTRKFREGKFLLGFLSFEKEFQKKNFYHFLPYLYTKTDFAIAFVVYVIAKGILQQHLSFYPG